MTNVLSYSGSVVLRTKDVRAAMASQAVPEFEMRHRMSLALEYGDVSINEIAKELGASRTTISNYLHGRTRPRRADLVVWSLRCGVPFEWVIGGDSEFAIELDDDEGDEEGA